MLSQQTSTLPIRHGHLAGYHQVKKTTGDALGGCSRSASSNSQSVRQFDISELLDGQQEVIIVHNGDDYRLRITSNGKLILTK
jgi:hemin uptake protein HemP